MYSPCTTSKESRTIRNPKRLSTGNELLSIPEVSTQKCAVETIGFLHHGLRAVVELSGSEHLPFLQPVVTVDGNPAEWEKASWWQEESWIPSFSLSTSECELQGRIFAPLQCRGFVYSLEIQSKATRELVIRAGWQANWQKTSHATYTAKAMTGVRRAAINQWLGIPFIEFQSVAPHFAVAFRPSEVMETELFLSTDTGRTATLPDGVVADADGATGCSMSREFQLEPGEKVSLALFVGLGLEEISAASSAVDLSRRGHERLLRTMLDWLADHSLQCDDKQLQPILNLNGFYNFFYSQGVTLDTEEHVVVTSRSSRYPLTTAYSDRDALLWSLPAILRIDPQSARRMLDYAFRVQIRNVGIHSRFIDGIVLEPGFELDELCSPVHGLWRYLQATGDMSVVFDRQIQAGINHILEIAALKKHPDVWLFETALLPSDDVAMYPYVTYDNVMVWRMLRDLSDIYERIGDIDRKDDMTEQSRRVKQAIMEHTLVDGPFGEMFAWSVDLQGNHRLLDHPQGSQQLLAYMGFCSRDLEQYKNTVRWIHSDENPAHSAAVGGRQRLSMFSLANDLLMGPSEETLEFLRRAPLDDGLFCEIVDAETGKPISGQGYAACAGFVTYALSVALDAGSPAVQERDRSVSPQFRVGESRQSRS